MDFENQLGLSAVGGSADAGAAFTNDGAPPPAAATPDRISGAAANGSGEAEARRRRLRQVNLHLVANGFPAAGGGDAEFGELADGLVEAFREKAHLLGEHRCPADQRIEAFLRSHFAELKLSWEPRLPGRTLPLDRHGIARELSVPVGADAFSSPLLESYRLKNGILHNPRSDRRTTEGTFHVADGGLPVPGDKRAVPKRVYAELFRHAMIPPADLMTLPFTAPPDGEPSVGEPSVGEPSVGRAGLAVEGRGAAGTGQPTTRDPQAQTNKGVRTFVSLLLRPLVCPEVPGVCPRKTMEVRFFAPASLVSNLDFVESIFGNAGDPFLARNDAGLDVEHWTGHTGCVILAPHLVHLSKKELGLPAYADATERQKRDGMCWREPGEKYNGGSAFKITCRTGAGVVVTIVADNYYGYCKKEVKTQISYAANLYGNVEEEHAGGAVAFAGYSFGDEFHPDPKRGNGRTFADVHRDYGAWIDVRPEGYGVDKNYPDLLYIPEGCRASVARQEIWWTREGKEHAIPLTPGKVYMNPSGFKLRIEKHPGAPSWRIIGTNGFGTVCHKPCTVSGGGKSEISKSLRDYMLYGPIFVAEVDKDLAVADEIFARDYQGRWKAGAKDAPDYSSRKSRPILGPERSLGSVIKLLTPSADYTDAYNDWLASIPNYIYPIVFIIKRFSRKQWGDWRAHFGVDIVNGFPGHELKFGERKLVGTYLRVGLMSPQAWRTYKVRQDFAAATKIQTEDDITASVVVPAGRLAHLGPRMQAGSYKFVENCEYRLFQRPDDAVHRGLDKQTESDLSRPDNFLSNFEPLTAADAAKMAHKVAEFGQFTPPMRALLERAAGSGAGYVVSSSNPRLVDGKPSKNPRYLQIRPDLVDPMARYVAEQGVRLFRAVPAAEPVLLPVDAVLVGRRNNPPDAAHGIRSLAVYNPIHYQELPELFMDFICSLTGKSPSTTGAGSEGALTKGPFNALRPTADLNAALVSFILTGLGGFSTAAGYVGPHVRVDHDVSLLVPEIWCRLSPAERDPATMIARGHLEPVPPLEFEGEQLDTSRLGYRITAKFVRAFFGRIFDNPAKVFDEAILQPETQDKAAFADGVKNIVETQQRVARTYFDDGSIEAACPPLKALLAIMAHGSHEGKTAQDPALRAMFTRENLLASDWYHERLKTKQQRDVALWQRHVKYVEEFLGRTSAEEAGRLGLEHRRAYAAAELARANSPAYLESLTGTLGAEGERQSSPAPGSE